MVEQAKTQYIDLEQKYLNAKKMIKEYQQKYCFLCFYFFNELLIKIFLFLFKGKLRLKMNKI